ncbi:protein-L-isoaspartate(D-aspartate) O-methyltransferase [Candidatus Electrothrix aarhusensis]|uniref:Protein-L-isoaspartate O-methyltransferase n=1 Tax=Candidatus Electrothrix aarhusensis TaxID=1859131 RepID=A0A444IYL1_9BACT|nr:protein-L-isoaspartate(D-aspartate) O-methyltransferase [Candidatus Electrothrix aarhusensis]
MSASSLSAFAIHRQRMMETLVERGIQDSATLRAMNEVPRHQFVEDAMQARSYGEFPLPIGSNQTISQPFVVAMMTQALQLQGHERVLEIGTGSGYQAAVLSRLCKRVYTVERIHSLLGRARKVFDQLHYYNIISCIDDGTVGWPDQSPFDAVLVTAGGPKIPEPLIEQLADPGRMVMPVGTQEEQELQLLEKRNRRIRIQSIGHVRFVNLIGEHGWRE